MPREKKSTASEPSSQSPLRTKTVPDMFLKQKQAASKKRNQRMENSSDEEDREEDELNSSDNDSEQDSDEEVALKRKKPAGNRRKTVSSKTVVNVSSQLLEQLDEETLNNQDTLFDNAIIPENSMDKVAEKWIKQYKRNQKTAIKDLINFLIRSSGCLMALTANAMDEGDGPVTAIDELQRELRKLPVTEYPIISKAKEYSALRRNMLLLFEEIISQCQHDVIFDGVMIETIQNWVATMSSSVYRPFRHTATLVGLRIISALCDVGEQCRDKFTTNSKQLKAENKKGESAANRTRLRSLRQKDATLKQKCKDVELFLTDYFNSIFVHRSRDVESVIRVECIRELCNWMQGYQAYFAYNSYLRFMGWALNDPSGNVRSETIKSLTRLYKIEDIANKFDNFTGRFKARIEEMALSDVDVSVRINAIQLCSSLFKLGKDILSTEGRKKLCSMIASDVPRVRKSAAPFVKTLIDVDVVQPLSQGVSNALSAASKPRTGRRSTAASAVTAETPINHAWVSFKGFASFLVERSAANNNEDDKGMEIDSESSVENRSLIIKNTVEALWDQMKELQDYASLCDYLARDHSQTQQQQNEDRMDTENDIIEDCYRLTEDEETVLINLLTVIISTAMSKGLDKNLPEGRDKKKKVDDGMLEETKNELSRHLVQVLPNLLSKHSDDITRMTQLVSIPALMNLSVYVELRAEKEYDDLLETLNKVYLGATSNELLTNCADSLQHINKNTSLSEIKHLHLNELKEAVVDQVREACSGRDLVTASYTHDAIHSVSVSMFRLACLINFSDATAALEDYKGASVSVIEIVGSLVDRATFGEEKEINISHSALTALSRYIMWKCSALSSSSTSEVIPLIERRRDWAIDKLVELTTGNDVSPLPQVRVAAFGYLVDIYWIFTSSIFDDYGLSRLKTRCPSELQVSCHQYVSEQVDSFSTASENVDEEKDLLLKLVTSYARGILVGVFNINTCTFLLEHYGSIDIDVDDIVNALVSEFQQDLTTGEVAADGICRAYMDALKNSFDKNVGDSARSIDKTVKLARLEAGSLKRANELDIARGIPPHIVCERIHLDGISFALTKAAEAYDVNKDDEKDNALKFFKILAVFGKELTRARDIAKIHNHLEDFFRQSRLQPDENQKEWEYYSSYVKSIDAILKKKGLRYDATKRANNAETPAAYVFNDAGLEESMADIDELAVRDRAKRTLMEAQMDIDDDESATKRRRDD